MSANKQILIYAFVLFAGLNSAAAISQEIEIKGLKLGMSKADVELKFGEISRYGYIYEFTIGGVESQYGGGINLEFHEDKLDEVWFFFDADGFDAVRKAVASKYPALKCSGSTVSNAMGASFRQTKCSLKNKIGTLSISRFVSEINTSLLSMRTPRSMNELMDKAKEKQGDI